MASSKHLEVLQDNVEKVFNSIRQLLGKQVLVGIPDGERNSRPNDEINNATLGYIHEFGSPLAHIPARPFLLPGEAKSRKASLSRLRRAAKSALDGDHGKALQFMHQAGIAASNQVREEISHGAFVPLSPRTIANRWRGRDGARGIKSRRESEQVYLRLVAKGASPAAAQIDTDIHALINTGRLRNSITYVIRDAPITDEILAVSKAGKD